MTHLPGPVVSTQWLADHLGADDLLVVDATVLPFTQPSGAIGYFSGHESYVVNGHLPGAVFADLVDEFSEPDGRHPFTRPGLARFETAAGALGVGADTVVVVYDAVQGQWAARLWWLFRAFGFDSVAVLDGGLTAWQAEGRTLEVGHVEPTAVGFAAAERPELWIDKAGVEAIVAGAAPGTLVCATPSADFALRHIPGSVSVPLGRLLERGTNTLRSVDALRDAFASVLADERIVVYCRGGIAAASDALALTILGHRNVALYDGSLSEWAADPAAPLVAVSASSEVTGSRHTKSVHA